MATSEKTRKGTTSKGASKPTDQKKPGRAAKTAAPAASEFNPEAVSSDSLVTDATTSPDKGSQSDQPTVELKKNELIDLVVERSGIKKRDAKPAIEAALAILGQALADGRPLNLRPLGKVKVSNMKHKENALVLNLRLRQPSEAENGENPS